MKRIGILSFTNVINYGAALQVYALKNFLSAYSETKVINYTPKKFYWLYYQRFFFNAKSSLLCKIKVLVKWIIYPNKMLTNIRKTKRFKKFFAYLNLTKDGSFSNDDFDFVVVGSDQVWNFELSDYDKTFLLNNIDANKSKTYAVSFGKESISKKEIEFMSPIINNFSSYLVREKSGQKILKDNFDINSELVCDPTFLLSKNEWDNVASKKLLNEKYIVLYIVTKTQEIINRAIEFAKNNNYLLVIIGEDKVKYKRTKYFRYASPQDFISLIKFSEYVFTTSYHGILFSIIYEKEFVYELSSEKINQNARIVDILNRLEIENEQCDSLSKINWEKVNSAKKTFVMQSKNFLLNSIGIED